jgi:hypothetical protein
MRDKLAASAQSKCQLFHAARSLRILPCRVLKTLWVWDVRDKNAKPEKLLKPTDRKFSTTHATQSSNADAGSLAALRSHGCA